jgi:FkbM family methyltransferase
MRLTTFKRLFAILGPMANRRSMHNFLLAAEITRGFDSPFLVSWSHTGEDIGLNHYFKHRKFGTYIDVGAFNPSKNSNTRQLYQRGWRGVNIDANEDLISDFLIERPEDKNICTAIGSNSEYQLFLFDELLVSTTNKKNRDFELSRGRKVTSQRKVNGMTLRNILDRYFSTSRPTLLTIDIEGADFDALHSISFETLEPNRFPEYLLLETAPPVSNSLAFPAVELAQSFGYIPALILPMATLLIAPDVI